MLAVFCSTLTTWAAYSGTSAAPQQITAENYSSYGFTASNYSAFVGYYAISSAEELYGFAALVNSGSTSIKGVLTADIVVNDSVLNADGSLKGNGFKSWTPIGTYSYNYSGTFDGNGHTVSGLYFYKTTSGNYPNGGDQIGLIGYSNGAAIKNVGLVDSYLHGRWRVAGICGYSSGGTITNCYNTSTINAPGNVAAGIFGEGSNCKITSCYNQGLIKGGCYVAGIAAYNSNGTVTDCYTVGTVEGLNSPIGGIYGSYNGTANNCYILNGTVSNSTANGGTFVTAADFASGKVASNLGFYQTLGTDSLPVLDASHGRVYRSEPCPGEYSNEGVVEKEHNYVDGVCTGCGKGVNVPLLTDGWYEINNATELKWFAARVNEGYNSINGRLVADIVLNDSVLKADGTPIEGADTALTIWTPMGTSSYAYAGTFDGQGHTISGLYFNNTSTSYVGLFGYVNNPTIKNVGLVDSYIKGNQYVGGIFGYSNGAAKISNCYNAATVYANYNGDSFAGGICGSVLNNDNVSIDNCYNTGYVYAYNRYAGGICGYQYRGTITNSYNTGRVYANAGNSTTSSAYAGGITGYLNNSASIVKCHNIGDVEAYGQFAGGITGNMNNSNNQITNCYNLGNVTANQYSGGICGRLYYGTISKCFTAGSVTGNSYIGGIYGSSYGGSTSGNYILSGSAANSYGGTFATADEFASGKIAYVLNGSVSGGATWRQNIGTDSLPVMDVDHAMVYTSAPCPVLYGNTITDYPHTFDSFGKCTACGEYKPATLVADATVADSLGLSEDYVGFYAISLPGHLYWFASQVNSGSTSIKGILTDDIVVNDSVLNEDGSLNGTPARTWTPIGTSSYAYAGTFDGQGHTISGLYFNNTGTSYVGLFGYISNPTIKNVGLVDSYIKGNQYVGGIAGYVNNSAQITNCYNATTVYANNNSYSYAGGICGRLGSSSALIDSCYNIGYVSGYYQYVGGICGCQAYGRITNSYNAGRVYSSAGNNTGNYAYAGGISGWMGNTASIADCYNTGDVEAYGYYAGGITGYMNSSDNRVTNCFSTGNITASNYASGITAYLNGTATNNFALSGSAASCDGGTFATADEFANGKVAYGLNGNTSTGTLVWFQTIGIDSLPVWDTTHAVVYAAEPCRSAFANSVVGGKPHTFNTFGQCTACGEYLAATFVADAIVADSLGLSNDYIGFYAISLPGHLYWFADTVNAGFTAAKGVLLNNIVVNDSVLRADGSLIGADSTLRVWTPIGTYSFSYVGTFDGNGHTISGLYFNNTSTSYVGLFGYISNPTIKNVGLVDSYIKGYQYVGGIAGYVNGGAQITNCHNAATVYANSGYSYVGGICGYMNSSTALVDNCCNTGYVSGYYQYAGGICGYQAYGTITNSYNTGRIYANAGNSTTNSAHAGGIAGYMTNSASIANSYNTGDVESHGYYAGGIIGYMYNSNNRVTNCYNLGSVTANQYAGSICGFVRYGTISKCFNAGNVTGNSFVGGIYGSANSASYSGNYILSGSAANSYGGTFATAEEFASGKIAYALNGNTSNGTLIWFQTIGTDSLPVFDTAHAVVYTSQPCPSLYGNTVIDNPHTFDTFGKCTVCGAYKPATLVADVAIADSLGLSDDYVGFYAIENAANLYWFADLVNNGTDRAAKAVLLADIVVNDSVLRADGSLIGDYSTLRVWIPIGSSSYNYNGTFDGNGYTISGLYFNNTGTSCVGLFGYVSSPTIKNVGLVDSYVRGGQYVGGIAGYVSSSAHITNCYNAATVYASGNSSSNAGGICGYLSNSSAVIDGCHNTGYVSGYYQYVGGICGYQNYGTITNSYNTGKVYSSAGNSTSNNAYVGGISGYMNTASITNCYNTGDVESRGYCAGGIVGYMSNNSGNTVTNCFNLESVKANQFAGGISGYQYNGKTSNCYNAGVITANSYAKGIAGNWSSGSLTNCYVLSGSAPDLNNGTLFSTADEFASGLIAFQLNGSTNGAATWHQNLSGTIDSLPVLDNSHGTVYMGCDSVFVNDMADAPHTFVNGVCSVCGTKEFPMLVDGWYEIENKHQLYWFVEQVNSGQTTINGKLVADIVLNDSVLRANGSLIGADTSLTVWTPMGTSSYAYAGTFDGQGHTISGLYFNNTGTSYVGLFGYVSNSTIKNVGLVDSYMKGYQYVGGIVGYVNGGARITNCYSEATVYANFNGESNAGGICGYMNNSSAVIENCYNAGYVDARGYIVGGICGYQKYGKITNCYNTGKIYAYSQNNKSYYSEVGGITGLINNTASIDNCYNTGIVESPATYAGGIVGYMNNSSTKVTNCYNSGNIIAYNNTNRGIVGYMNYTGTYTNNYVLNGSATNSNGGTFATADEFASGKIAIKLNNSVNGAATWRQNLSGTVDSLPVLDTTHALVYLSQPCRVVYANSDTTLEHQYDDFGQCTVCHEYLPVSIIANAAMADSLGLSDDYVGFYAIENAAHLYWFANLVNSNTNRAAKAVLLADIVVNDNVLTVDGSPIAGADTALRTWTPIGNSSYAYYGIFDGNGHTISGLYFNNTGTSFVGLFGNVSNPTIKNVGLVDSYIKGFQYVGGIAGYISNSAHITNCYNNATVYASGNSSSCAGGICGYLSNSSAVIDSCYNTGYVSGYYQYVGGICGNQNYGTITNSYNAGKVYSNAGNSTGSSTYVGGITGYMNNTASITNCYNTGDVEAYGYRVGGIVGQMNNSGNQVTNCYNLGNVKARGNAGGISGYLYVGTIANNYNNGEVEATNGNAGGISGGQDYGTITNSYNSGSVKTTSSYAGGVTGYVNYSTAQITNCYNVGTVTSNGYASGIAGNKFGVTAYNYALSGTAPECYGGSFATAEEFANGLVAYGLNGKTSENVVWFQTIGTDSLPVWDTTHAVVYATAPCDVICSNTPGGVKEHATCNALGQCPDCGKYLATPLFVATAGIADSLGLSGDYVGFYAIENAAQLYWFANEVNGGATNAKAVLLDNIVVNDDVLTADGSLNGDGSSSFAVWTPIGNNNRQYAGTFDGNGHTISGLYFNDEYADYVGLFGYVSYPTIKNVSIEDSYIEGRQYVAGIAGYIYSSAQISNCHNAATVYSAYNSENYVGGIAGNIESSSAVIDSCTNAGFISAYGSYVGGICGRVGYGTVKNSYNTGKIYSNSYNSTSSNAYVGGIAGYINNSASIRNSYNTADVEAKGYYAGGIVGYMSNSSNQITNCYNLGNVKAYGYAGGICGYQNYGTITKNYNIGIVTANSNVGGICGYRYSGTVSTNYVLKGTASSSNGGTFVSAAELASGKVAYWLNGSVSGGTTWFQTLGEDARPLFDATHAKVYTSAPCPYSNDTTGVREHSFNEIGLCSVCGSGTQPSLVDGWYEIDNAGKLYWFAQTVNAYADSASIKGRLTADIVVNDSVLNTNGSLKGSPEFEWTPIGSSSITYKGTFDGQGHTISGLYFNNTNTTYVGLFGYTNNATISNVGLVDSYINANQQVGGIVGRMSGNTQIANCYSRATVNSGSYSGGLCGYLESGTISNSYFAGTLLSSGSYIYGISGYNAGTIAKCYVLTGSASLANTGASFRTAAEFASGSVAHLLNDTVDGGSLWRQTLSIDAFPVLDTASGKVYASAPCPFSNDTTGVQQHQFGADGFCIYCHASSAPSLVDGWYEIENAGHLMWFAQQVNTYADSAAIKGKLMADIVLNSNVLAEDGTLNGNPAVEWTPIGTSSITYKGTFDGQGHTISGLYLNNTSKSYVGLFGYTSSATIQNVGVEDSYIRGYQNIGGIAGYANETNITNCHFAGYVYGSYYYVGGISGGYGVITNCYNAGKIVGGSYYTGGICGMYGTQTNCYNAGAVNGYYYTGGICGYYGTQIRCYNIGTVTGSSYYRAINGSGGSQSYCYYLNTSASTAGGGSSATAEEFANGRVAYLLNASKSDSTVVWRQNIGTDLLPIADSTHAIVYLSAPCPVYSNVAEKEHGTCNALGQCPDCGHYLTAPLYVATSAIADSLGLDEKYVGYYAISNAAQLYGFADMVNSGSTSIKGVLLNDITVNSNVLNGTELNGDGSNFAAWTPIGTSSYNYYGTFDGNGHTVSGLYFNDANTSYVGLFGYIGGPTIKNVGVVDSYLKGYEYVAGIAGYVNSSAQITNCYNEATVYASYQYSYSGGICGRLGSSSALIDSCYNIGYVSGYYQYVGGICGCQYNGTITNSYNAGKVYSSAGNSTGNYAYTGGISGYMLNSASIENCYNSGDVETYGYRAGGITGYIDNQNNKIAGCYNVGRVSARNYASGITAYLNGVTTNNFALSGTAANCEGGQFATAEEFASGKVTFALNNNIADSTVVWFQTLGTDSLPVWDNTHGIVYAAEPCHSAFANSAVGGKPHTFDVFGKCTVCGEYEPATFVADAAVADSLGLDESYVGFYAIERAAQLYWFAEQVNSGSTEINGVLLNNIVVNDSVLTEEGVLKVTPARTWSPIGTNYFSYAGTFDGNGYTISGLYFNDVNALYVGLFGYVNNPTIANVGVVDSYFKGCQYMGGIVGRINGSAKITNCFNAATIYANASGDCDAGGICGYMGNSTVIDGCYNIGFITVYLQIAGGICGYQNNGTITNCYNTGKVHSSAGNSTGNNAFAGGISGYMTNSASIANCYNTGDVDGYGNYVGGIAGYMYNSSNQVTNSYNLGSVKANQYAGGISGYHRYGTTSNCYNAGAITANSYARGISGYWISGSRINCYVLSGSASDNGGGTFATADDFASGLIAYQLNGSENNGAVWHQNLNSPVDSLPVLDKTHAPVWMGCDSVFVNDMADAPHHFVDGVCSVCGVKEFPMLVDGWYEIENQYQLYWFAEQVNSGKTTINGKLVTDIVVNDSVLDTDGNLYGADSLYKAWTPIGTTSYKFAGSFDGQGHTVSGLYFNNTNSGNYPNGGDRIGLIGYANSATIKNVGVVDSYLYGNYQVSGICAYSTSSTITNCWNASTIKSSYNVASGIMGEGSYNTITACYNEGLISGAGFSGGIVGYLSSGSITNSYNTGEIAGRGNYAAGIVAYLNGGTVTGNYTVGTVNGGNYVGGVYGGFASSSVTKNYVLSGSVSSNNGGTFVTANDFASGKVAYSLTGGDTLAPVWHQTLFADAMPVLDTTRNIVAGYVETVGDEIIVHGNLIVATDYVIAEGKTLVVPAGASLTTADSAVITNNGKLAVDGTLAAESIEGAGEFVYRDITDAELTLVSTSVTYKGSEFTVADGLEVEYLTRTAFGKTLTFDAENADVAYSANRNAGTATVVWTVSDTVTISREFTIEPRSLTITVDSTYNKAYDGTTVATGIISSNKVEGDNLAISYTAAFANANAGADKAVSYSFSVSGADAANYVLASATETTVANIEPATGVVVTVNGKRRVVVYNGNEQVVTGYNVTFNNAIYTAADFTFSGVDTVKATNAGTYAMQLADSLFSNINANFADVTFVVNDGSLIITKAATAPNKPQATMQTRFVNTQLVELPDGWRWNEYRALEIGTNKDTAIYVGADAGNYNIERAVVTITRLACLHNEGDSLLYVLAPTCTHAGYTGNHCCKLCGEIYEYGDSIPALGHAYDTVVVAPTCTAVGYTQLTCSRCGEVVNTDTVPALGHTPDSIVIENVVAATYTTAGSYDSVVYCSVCHVELSRTTIEVPMLIAAAQKIELKSMPKVEYVAGEKLDVSGAVVVVTFSNGTTKEVALSAAMVSGFDAEKVGEQTLTVTFKAGDVTLTATFEVTVEADDTAVDDETANTANIYAYGNTIVVENATDEIRVYNAMGGFVAASNEANAKIRVNGAGIYIVKTGQVSKRVMVY